MQDRSQQDGTGHLNEPQCVVLVVDAGEVDDDGVPLPDDFGFGDTQRVDTLTDSLHGQVEALGIELPDWLLGDRHSALQVETESRVVAGDEVADEHSPDDQENGNEIERESTTHRNQLPEVSVELSPVASPAATLRAMAARENRISMTWG